MVFTQQNHHSRNTADRLKERKNFKLIPMKQASCKIACTILFRVCAVLQQATPILTVNNRIRVAAARRAGVGKDVQAGGDSRGHGRAAHLGGICTL